MPSFTTSAPMSAAQLGELALDAAIQIDRFIAHDGTDLDCARALLQSISYSLRSGTLDDEKPAKFELSYLSIYERVVPGDISPTVEVFSSRVQAVLDRFIAAAYDKDETLLPSMRDLCLAVHDQALSERLDVIATTQPTLRRGSYA